MAFSPEAVANELLRLAKDKGDDLSPMKLQKLAYISHGWHLGLLDGELLNESVEAWKYGPVIPSLYHEFKHFRMRSINEPATTLIELPSGKTKWVEPAMKAEDPDSFPGSSDLIEAVYENYRQYTAVQLSNATHREGTPWHQIYMVKGKGNPPYGTDIPNDLIQEHYKKLAGLTD